MLPTALPTALPTVLTPLPCSCPRHALQAFALKMEGMSYLLIVQGFVQQVGT